MISGARAGRTNGLRRLVAWAAARDLAAFVVPGLEVARAHGLDPAAAGLRVVNTPRHASVLLVVGGVPDGLRDAVAVVYAQMPRPRAVLALGAHDVAPLPEPDVVAPLQQAALAGGVDTLRMRFASGAFSTTATDFDVAAVWTETKYVCPMHPEIARNEPGTCPICGMDLVPQAGGGEDADHGDMAMGRHDAGEQPAEPATGGYTCPMHPEVVRDQPDSCPICGMALVPRAEAGQEHGSATPNASHAGHDGGDGGHGGDHAGEVGREAMGHVADSMPSQGSRQGRGAGHPGHVASHGQEVAGAPHGGARYDAHGTARGEGQESPAGHGDDGEESGGGHGGHDAMLEMQHGQRGEHDGHGMQMQGGFMSMVMMTQDLPRSADGLPMEWVEAPFGPLFSGLPGGLALTFTLDGDTVAEARLSRGKVSRNLADNWPGPLATFPDRLARLDPLASVAYCLLARRACEDAAGIADDAATARVRIGALERERAASHLNWLAGFARLLGDDWLAGRASRLHHAILRATDAGKIAALRDDARTFARWARRTPLLRRRLVGIGTLDHERAPGARRCGPVARGAGEAADARESDLAYRDLGFVPVTREGDDAWARLDVRLAELEQSLDLVVPAGAVNLPDQRETDAVSGIGSATVETPRGAATLRLTLAAGRVTDVHLETPSTLHVEFVKPVAEGREVADALVGVASLDLSPWEIDR